MPRNRYLSLLIEAIDNVNDVKNYCEFLRMALEQLDNPDDKTLDRVSLLIETFLSKVEPSIDSILVDISREKDKRDS